MDGAVPALLLDVLQEVDDERRVELLDRQPGRACPGPRRGELQQKFEADRIGLAGLRTIATLARHVVPQEARDERSERRHAASLPTSISAAAAMSVIISGVACRYQ